MSRRLEDALDFRNILDSKEAKRLLQDALSELGEHQSFAATQLIDDLVCARLTESVQDAMLRLGFAASAPDALASFRSLETALEKSRQDLATLAKVIDRMPVKLSPEEKDALSRAECAKE